MPMSVPELRRVYKTDGPMGFLHMVHHQIGLRTADGLIPRNRDGVQVLESEGMGPRNYPRMPAENYSIKEIGCAIFGSEDELMDRITYGQPVPGDILNRIRRSANVLEAGNAIIPQQFADITVYNEAVAGLFEVKILEGYQRPEYSLSKMIRTVGTLLRQEKFIGISTPADASQERKPGQTHPEMELQERYVTTRITENRANSVHLTREAVKWDLTRQLLEHAELVGSTLGLAKEYDVCDVVLGIINPYTYGGTTYYTYVNPADAAYWGNLFLNDVSDWTCLDLVNRAFSKMVDQETGQPISVDARDLVCMPARESMLDFLVNVSQNRMARFAPSYSALGAWPAGTSDLGVAGYGKNPMGGKWNTPFSSQYLYKRAVDNIAAGGSHGTGLIYKANTQQTLSAFSSQAITTVGLNYADSVWFAGNFAKAFVYVEQIPLTTVRATPDSYTMANRGLVLSVFVDQMGNANVMDPRFVCRNQGWTVATANW